MEAAFVEIGLEKNGFLYVDEIVGPELEGSGTAARSRTCSAAARRSSSRRSRTR